MGNSNDVLFCFVFYYRCHKNVWKFVFQSILFYCLKGYMYKWLTSWKLKCPFHDTHSYFWVVLFKKNAGTCLLKGKAHCNLRVSILTHFIILLWSRVSFVYSVFCCGWNLMMTVSWLWHHKHLQRTKNILKRNCYRNDCKCHYVNDNYSNKIFRSQSKIKS